MIKKLFLMLFLSIPACLTAMNTEDSCQLVADMLLVGERYRMVDGAFSCKPLLPGSLTLDDIEALKFSINPRLAALTAQERRSVRRAFLRQIAQEPDKQHKRILRLMVPEATRQNEHCPKKQKKA